MAQKLERLRQLLNKIASENKYEKPEVIINEVSTNGANVTSKLYTVIIREENKEDLHLFAKVAAAGESFRSELPSEIYNTEQFFYTKLSKIYASLEEENQVPEEHRLYFTKCYGMDSASNEEIMVLENLVARGYGDHDRFHSIDWEYASSAVTNLAKFHALSFAYKKRNPEEFEKTVAALKMDWKEYGSMDDLMKRSTNVALGKVKPEYKEALEKFLENQGNPFKQYAPVRITALIHTDFRGNNLLHKVREDGKVDIKIVDLQTVQGGSPIADLMFFIFTGSDQQFRTQYYDKLIEHYYTQLSAALKRLNLDPEETYSRAEFDYELKEKLPFGLTMSVYCLPLLTLDTENAPEIGESLEFSEFPMEKTNDLYTERLNAVVEDFVKWGVLK